MLISQPASRSCEKENTERDVAFPLMITRRSALDKSQKYDTGNGTMRRAAFTSQIDIPFMSEVERRDSEKPGDTSYCPICDAVDTKVSPWVPIR